ncbi:hypothetical protein LUZ60_009983 [Juncus effusus]|nr:hypothetical protein LUZ60_009983 [Juncus effusus]
MGCAGSKQVEVSRDVYKPPPTSISLFDITKVEEPWLIGITNDKLQDQDNEEEEEEDLKKNQITAIPLPLLQKLDSYEADESAPTSWTEVSKALEDLKPSIDASKTAPLTLPSNTKKQVPSPKSKATSNPSTNTPASAPIFPPGTNNTNSSRALKELGDIRPVRNNSFLIQDREQKKFGTNEAVAAAIALWKKKRDPLDGYPERRPPGKGGDGVVLYTTSLRGVRRTFEDCDQARKAVEAYAVEAGIKLQERDVSLHGEYLKEIKELVEEGVTVPRLFMRGRYIGGIDEVIELAETGKMREMMKWVDEGKGERKECQGCGGARFVPCWQCNGSCKVVAEDGKGVERCGVCNENGLALCPMCH